MATSASDKLAVSGSWKPKQAAQACCMSVPINSSLFAAKYEQRPCCLQPYRLAT